MRIISGTHKSKRITAPKNLPVRPTTDMAKESLFNILNNSYYFDEIRVLDLFCGTGNISYEFASRGSEKIVSIDNHFNCVRFVQQTAKELGFDAITALQSDVFEFLAKHSQEYDVIFADPPYQLENIEQLSELIFKNKLLSAEGTLIIEHSKETDLSEMLYFVQTRRYGNVNFSFFEQDDNDESIFTDE